MQLPKIPFAVLDTETTGFVPRVHHIMEFACVRVEHGKIAEEYEELLSVPDEIPPHVQSLTRIRTADIAGKPRIGERQDAIIKTIGSDTLLVGQNLGFDIGMLKGEGIDLTERPWIDTSMLASLVFPELASYSLGYVSQVLKLNHSPVHRALGDVHATLELLSKCWERMCSLPQAQLDQLRDAFGRSTEGYRLLAGALPAKSDGSFVPVLPQPEGCVECAEETELKTPAAGTVTLHEEDLHPAFLHRIMRAASKDKGTRHWIAVKNLEATVRRCVLPKGVSVLYPPFLLPHQEAIERLAAQKELTSDEATLLLKLQWFSPKTRAELAIHGNEKDIWAGRIACTENCEGYQRQFEKLESVVLVDQRQLFQFLREKTPEAQKALAMQPHIIIDDASMLEETATKAFGDVCALQELRAAAEQHPVLQKLSDMLALWVEQVRQNQDMRFLAKSDLEKRETVHLREQLGTLLDTQKDLPPQARRLMTAALTLLDPAHLAGRVTWIEVWQNGSVVLQAYPERIDFLLKEHLFEPFPTTLLVPKGAKTLPLVTPQQMPIAVEQSDVAGSCVVSFPEGSSAQAVLTDPLPGKTVVLLGSRKAIEQCYVRFVEELEQKGITLLCQGLSGSTGRMEAEFAAAASPAICVLTPWTYEGFELPEGTVDHVVLDQVPFDSPSQPMIQVRSKFVSDGFADYLLPKLEHRLFRLLRTLKRHAAGTPTVAVYDERLRTKQYGGRVMQYLTQFSGEAAPVPSIAPAKKPRAKKSQPSLF